ncbi:MAG: RNA polymerase sigma factor [Bacteroidota bacterium]
MQQGKETKTIIRRLIMGDTFAFDEVFNIYYSKIYSFAFKNLKNKQDAEEIVQEVFFFLWKDRKNLKKVKNLDAWLFTISFNIIRKYFRKIARRRKYLKNQLIKHKDEENSISAEVKDYELRNEAEYIIEHLPPKQKTVFKLSKIEGMNNSEIAQKLNINIKTVENHLSNAKTFLKKYLFEEDLLIMFFLGLFISN